MNPFKTLSSIVVPLERNNVDTDAIIPKQFLKSIKRTGFGANLFDEWRYLDKGEPGMDCALRPKNMDFVLNFPQYQNAEILLARQNFGCGSSREHAPWALMDYGFRVIIAQSFADIFYNNSFKNGLLPIVLKENEINELFDLAKNEKNLALTVDLEKKQIFSTVNGKKFSFEIDDFRRECLLNGWDDIGLTLRHQDEILAFENKRRQEKPWLFQA